jgi:phenylpropionate dioxygenase-like ring-hydroxylating dioxygenase large terminal subunit
MCWAPSPAPPGARVRTYALEERWGIVWIWMGHAEAAPLDEIPDFALLGDDESYVSVRGYTYIEANYELVLDNLMDLSHVEFLHPGLRTEDPEEQLHEVRQDGDTVWSMRWRKRGIPSTLLQNFWPAESSDVHVHMRWSAPSNLFLDVGVTGVNQPESEGVLTPFAHLLTPAEDGKTHYHWASIRNARKDDPALDERIRTLANAAFVGEDKPIIEAQQANLTFAQALGVRPVLLGPDAAAVRVQRVLERRLAEEAKAEQAAEAP